MVEQYNKVEPAKTRAERVRQIVTAVVFLAIVAAGAILNIVISSPTFIQSERRRPAERPALNMSNLTSGDFARGFEEYSADNFIFRERLRTVRSLTTFYVFMHSDRNGLYFNRHSGIGRFEMMNKEEYRNSAARIRSMFPLFEDLEEVELYFAIIPDKSYYGSNANRRSMTIDPHRAAEIVSETMSETFGGVTLIDLTDSLTIDDFYRTDLHWKQTRLGNVLQTLSQAMNFPMPPVTDTVIAGEWFGVYYGQLAIPMRPDIMEVHRAPRLTARYMNEHESLRTMTPVYERGTVYDLESFHGVDPYSIFLRGPQPVVWIDTNLEQPTDRTLYVFRDSFASSIAPLIALSEGYDQVVLIDLRYIDGRILERFVEFTPNSDILFLYSTQILNNSSMFRGR
jgi:hypothetical protein